ncbi:MAG: histidine phosphatase family protein [Candidatus Eremiobacteraeota bacterium]|nr:histidine phosphatase family protein [Candidatus Eremiobacteraeota bacterium]
MATLWIARHGETTWNVAGRYQGRMESDLSPLGERQARAIADAFFARSIAGDVAPVRIVSSPLRRCLETARFSAERLGLAVERDERLIEIAHGTWDGRYRETIAGEDPVRFQTWRKDPANVSFENGESLADVLARWRSFARDAARATRDTLVVTHDAVVRCAIVDLSGRTLDDFWNARVENGAFATLEASDGRLRLVDECDVRHLGGIRANVTGQAL